MHSRDYLNRLSNLIQTIDDQQFENGITAIEKAWTTGRQIITLGNGGSAMTALHFVTDWSKMIFLSTGRPFRARTLLDNIGMITAYANDISYAHIFSEQIRNIACPGDLVIAVSGSGNSENVVKAIITANEMGCDTLGLCGFSGGRLKKLAKTVIWVQSNDMQLCEDIHAIFGHVVMQRFCGVPPG